MERIVLLNEEPRDRRHVLKGPNVLQHYEQVAISHHEGRGQHCVASPVPHHPQQARPHEEDECQPADVRDAPSLNKTNHRTLEEKDTDDCLWPEPWLLPASLT